ncbi:hypothetical protein PLESTF_000182800 [Pleodorina starrii]|nr:hypothetical protein PLESTF_000182800 [Pleodorina starrii]
MYRTQRLNLGTPPPPAVGLRTHWNPAAAPIVGAGEELPQGSGSSSSRSRRQQRYKYAMSAPDLNTTGTAALASRSRGIGAAVAAAGASHRPMGDIPRTAAPTAELGDPYASPPRIPVSASQLSPGMGAPDWWFRRASHIDAIHAAGGSTGGMAKLPRQLPKLTASRASHPQNLGPEGADGEDPEQDDAAERRVAATPAGAAKAAALALQPRSVHAQTRSQLLAEATPNEGIQRTSAVQMHTSADAASPHAAAQLQPDGDGACSPQKLYDSTQLGPIASLTESEEDQFRRLEEEILAAAAENAAAGPARAAAGARSAAAAAALLRRGCRDRRWKQRVLAVAAFKMAGQHRRIFEEDILSVAASICSDMGSMASGSYSLDESLLQPQQLRQLSQNASDGPGGGGGGSSAAPGHGRWSAPVYARSRGVFTEEDEDVMSLIVGQVQGPPS